MSSGKAFTREALYSLVWSEPMSSLAPNFGISDVALKNTCAKANIPVPDRGHWAKRQAGKNLPRPPLPPRPPGRRNTITVGGGARPWYYQQHYTEAELLGPLPNPPVFDQPIEEVRQRVQRAIGKVSVLPTLAGAHRAIVRHLEEDVHRREQQRKDGYAYSWNSARFDSPFEQRRLRILNTLFLAIERLDAKASTRGHEAREVSVRVGEQFVSLTLDRPPISARRPQLIEESSNQLVLTIPGPDAERLTWRDDEKGKIERKLSEIAVELIVTGESQYRNQETHTYQWRIKRKADLEAEIARTKFEAERADRERLAKIEQAHVDRLLGEAAALRQAMDIRLYVRAVMDLNAGSPDPASADQLQAWQTWALAQADRIDPVVSRRFLEAEEMLAGRTTQ